MANAEFSPVVGTLAELSAVDESLAVMVQLNDAALAGAMAVWLVNAAQVQSWERVVLERAGGLAFVIFTLSTLAARIPELHEGDDAGEHFELARWIGAHIGFHIQINGMLPAWPQLLILARYAAGTYEPGVYARDGLMNLIK